MGLRGRGRRGVAILAASVASAGLAGACRDSSAGPRVALLLPEGKASRYETKDRPYFQQRVKELCPSCRVTYANAGNNPARQLSQVEAALANRADVVVLDPVDARAARAAAIRAEEAGVPLVAYDRLIDDQRVDWYVGFDNAAVGRLQAAFLADAVTGRPGGVVMLHGAPSDPNAEEYRQGATDELRRRGVTLVSEVAVEDWNPGPGPVGDGPGAGPAGNRRDLRRLRRQRRHGRRRHRRLRGGGGTPFRRSPARTPSSRRCTAFSTAARP